ncbi:hypothetical protein [Natronoglomus mannanivorans]|uniref:Uncharacterized protein n=1 Tax=Natronoglomus mannanivorans TaxID=2979990 RepID=A0AAP2Z027_9EURY|nr:hypothetical protein [Halobacteria archaeon AArc-xg1-1]
MTPVPAQSIAAVPTSITGLDLIVLLLLLHGWVVAVGIAAWSEGSGIDWVDQRVDVGTRSLALLWLVGTVVAWYPFATGEYPTVLEGRTRLIFVLSFSGLVLIWAGFYFLGAALTTLRSAVAIRRATEIDAGRETQFRRHSLETIAVCGLAAVGSTGAGFWLLWTLAGH